MTNTCKLVITETPAEREKDQKIYLGMYNIEFLAIILKLISYWFLCNN